MSYAGSVASGPTTDRPDEAPEDALDAPNLPDFRKLAHGDFSAVDWRIFWSLLPLVVFLVLNSFRPEDLWRTQVAIIASFAASTWVFATNRDSGVIRFITVLGFIVVAGSAVVGLAADSAKAFAAQNIYSDFLVAAVCLGSIAIGKPLVGAVARESIPALRTLMDPRHRVFVILQVHERVDAGTGPAAELQQQIGAARDHPGRRSVRGQHLQSVFQRLGRYISSDRIGPSLGFVKLAHEIVVGRDGRI